MRKMTCKKRSVNQPSRLFLFLCTAPTLILTVYFILVPTLKAFVLSFTDSTMLGINVHFVGLDNYAYMFHDKNFLQAMGNTLKLMLDTVQAEGKKYLPGFVLFPECDLSDRGRYYLVFCISSDHGNFKQFFKQRGSFWTDTFLDRRYKDSTCLYCSNSDLAGSWILYGHVCGGYGWNLSRDL